MKREIIFSKAQRLSRMSHLLYRQPRGLTTAELARLCNVTKRTIQRDLRDIEEIGIPLWQDEGNPPRYGIIEGYYLPPIHLTLDDALALYLAARLLARYADSFDPHITQALAKLAGILPESVARHIHATISSLSTRPGDARLVQVLGVLALGWVTGRKVRIRHRSAKSKNVHEYLFSPYFIEPSAVGNATYAIGYSSWFEQVHTFKVERILDAELTQESFEIPETFDGASLLHSAWGIMFGDEVEEVVLRFAPSAKRRVHETCWHPSQRVEDTADGGCILKVEVAHPREMIYWILGWGHQVEVLAPAWLREKIAEEARAMVEVYEKGKLV